MLYLIGLGLGDAKDITVKGLEVVRRCSRVYLEAYTSVLTVGKEALVGARLRGGWLSSSRFQDSTKRNRNRICGSACQTLSKTSRAP